MQECYSPAPSSRTWSLVYQTVAGRPAGLDGGVEVGDPVADVMNAGSPLGQESANRTVRLDWSQQLHFGLSKGERQNSGSVNGFRRMRLDSEHVTIKGDCRIQVGHGNADMRNAGAVNHRVLRTLSRLQENNKMGATDSPAVHVSDASFAVEIEQANGLVLVDFWASWCGPCQIVAPILDQLAGEYAGKAKVAKVDVDANQRTAMRFNVRSIPSILFFKNGQHVDTVIGAVPKATLEGKIKQHLS
jgi:thioredoxin 1